MPAKPLSESQKQDASRLRLLYMARKSSLGLSQESIAAAMGFANQSAVSQYFNGRIPLNHTAAIGFARLLHCSVSDFSPTIANELEATKRELNEFVFREDSPTYSLVTAEASLEDEIFWQFEDKEPEHASGRPTAAKPPPLWPFRRIKIERWESLSQDARGYIEAKLETLIEQAEAEAKHSGNRSVA